jgi:predicted nucleic acid-binding protein
VPEVVIDTDVASVLQKDTAPAWVHRHVLHAENWLSFVTVAEFWKWAEVRRWGETRRSRLGVWISRRPIIPYDEQVARCWGRLAAGAQLRGRPRPQNDTWIAACYVRHGIPLLTLNSSDFLDFARHDGLQLLTDPGWEGVS